MKKLLLLDNSCRADTNDMWRTAIQHGWETRRTDMYRVEEHCKGFDLVRYYGNVYHAAQIATKKLPFEFQNLGVFLDSPSLRPYTKRKIQEMHYGVLKQPIEERCFIKPAREKWFEARVYDKGESIIGDACKLSDDIYISEIVKFVDEVRCFVLDGEILTSSYYRINSIVWDQTEESPEKINFDEKLKDTPLREYAREIYKKYPHCPKGVTMDFGLLEDGSWGLVELNESWCSGLYYCQPDLAFECIINSQNDKQ